VTPSRGLRGRLPGALVSVALALLAIGFFFPMIWMVLSSFKSNAAIFSAPFSLPDAIDFGTWA
jgi:raffinose/stachyose/melibiose transport system permease protein